MRKLLLIAGALAILAGGGYAYYRYTQKPVAPTINTARVTRGDIAETVGATGALQAVTTVQVGTQVSGTILRAERRLQLAGPEGPGAGASRSFAVRRRRSSRRAPT